MIIPTGARVMIYPKLQVNGATICAESGVVHEHYPPTGEYLIKVDGHVWPWRVPADQVREIAP